MPRYNFRGTHFCVDQSPYPMPPYQYRNNEMLTLKVETDPDFLQALVPAPMQVNADNLLIIYVGALNVTEPKSISYGEAGLMVPVSLNGRIGTYLPVLYLDDMELLTSGREIWGFPKFPANVFLQRQQESVEARVVVAGIDIIRMQMNFQQCGKPVPVYDRDHFLLKSIPSVDGRGHDVRHLTTCRVRNDQRHEVWEGRAELKLRSTVDCPLGDIPIKQIVSAFYTVGDLILDRGEVVHNYLADTV